MPDRQGVDASASAKPVFAVLVAVTSRINASAWDTEERAWRRFQQFAASLLTSVTAGERVRLYIAIDKGDPAYDKPDVAEKVQALLGARIQCQVSVIPSLRPGRVCALWRRLARNAYQAGDDYFVFLGDDVIIETPGWPTVVAEAFQKPRHRVASRCDTDAPLLLGCVCLDDKSAAGFPTFPVVHRTHLDIFDGDMFPDTFVNQDADPFLYHLYRRWGASEILTDQAVIRNTIGGYDEARYRKESHPEWKNRTLSAAVDRVAQHLLENASAAGMPPRFITFDTIVPSYRCPLDFLARIADLPVPEGVSHQTIIIIDDPTSSAISNVYTHFFGREDVLVRVNARNLGASESRNRGLDESAADWVLFMDDDVVPSPGILPAYVAAIRSKHDQHIGAVGGFVGVTEFPAATNNFTRALHMSECTFFWTIAANPGFPTAPWGVTANLVARRDATRFRPEYPRTGGGEDIHYCLEHPGTFVCVPDARAVHPWWKGGRRDYRHFYGWAYGDGQCVDFWPEYTYRAAPSVAEALLAWILLVVCLVPRISPLCAVLGCIWILTADLVFLLTRHCVLDSASARTYPQLRGLPRLLAVVESVLVVLSLELGRLHGHLARRRLENLGLRFDWFAEQLPGSVQLEKRRAYTRLVLYVTGLAVLLATVDGAIA